MSDETASDETAFDSHQPLEVRLFSVLPAGSRDAAFEAFRSLYRDAFPLPDEQQDAEDWRQPAEEGKPQALVILAGAGFDRVEDLEVWGGIVAEYYPVSRCALLAYLVVTEEKRGRGIGRRLVDEAVERLREAARSNGQVLQALFGEAEDFRLEAIREKTDFAAARLVIQDRLGARWIDVPYVMPRLGPGKRRDPHLLLMTYPHPRVTLNATTVPLAAASDFLAEYYTLEQDNPADPRQGDELAAMLEALEALSCGYHRTYEPDRPWQDVPGDERQVPLKALPRPADPRLELREVAVCLHVVTVDVEDGWTEEHLERRYGAPELLRRVGRTRLAAGARAGEQAYVCPIYHSFEIDILSYRFQAEPPIESACASETQTRVRIRFPEEIVYVAEGLERRIAGARPELEVRASLTASCFPQTGVRIWHLALLPLHGEKLTELEVIRLIKLYYHEQEGRDLLPQTTFEIVGEGREGTFGDLLADLSWGSIDAERPAAGTIELNPAAGDEDAATLWTKILSALYLTTVDDQDGFGQLQELYSDGGVERLLDACCGVVSGHFDYTAMSFAEMQDTLAPDSSAGTYAAWFNRATLTSVDLRDEMLDRCGRTIGISPYLILPHAVLLHNELVVDQLEEVARGALAERERPATATDDRLARLVHARRRIERGLFRHYVPNVFHYAGERELYEVGSRTRGAREKKETGERLLADLNAHLRDEEEFRERRRGFSLTVLSVLLGLTVVLDVVRFLHEPVAWAWWSGSLVGLVVALSVAVLVRTYPRPTRLRTTLPATPSTTSEP